MGNQSTNISIKNNCENIYMGDNCGAADAQFILGDGCGSYNGFVLVGDGCANTTGSCLMIAAADDDMPPCGEFLRIDAGLQ